MQREIKYRAKSKDDPKLWIYGYFYIYRKSAFMEQINSGETLFVIPEALGQYIGLKDRNEIEIYEGDIVRFEGSQSKPWMATVEYHHEFAAFMLNKKGTLRYIDGSLAKRLTIIGNIHDNIELLEDE